jgi:hypothetical protein
MDPLKSGLIFSLKPIGSGGAVPPSLPPQPTNYSPAVNGGSLPAPSRDVFPTPRISSSSDGFVVPQVIKSTLKDSFERLYRETPLPAFLTRAQQPQSGSAHIQPNHSAVQSQGLNSVTKRIDYGENLARPSPSVPHDQSNSHAETGRPSSQTKFKENTPKAPASTTIVTNSQVKAKITSPQRMVRSSSPPPEEPEDIYQEVMNRVHQNNRSSQSNYNNNIPVHNDRLVTQQVAESPVPDYYFQEEDEPPVPPYEEMERPSPSKKKSSPQIQSKSSPSIVPTTRKRQNMTSTEDESSDQNNRIYSQSVPGARSRGGAPASTSSLLLPPPPPPASTQSSNKQVIKRRIAPELIQTPFNQSNHETTTRARQPLSSHNSLVAPELTTKVNSVGRPPLPPSRVPNSQNRKSQESPSRPFVSPMESDSSRTTTTSSSSLLRAPQPPAQSATEIRTRTMSSSLIPSSVLSTGGSGGRTAVRTRAEAAPYTTNSLLFGLPTPVPSTSVAMVATAAVHQPRPLIRTRVVSTSSSTNSLIAVASNSLLPPPSASSSTTSSFGRSKKEMITTDETETFDDLEEEAEEEVPVVQHRSRQRLPADAPVRNSHYSRPVAAATASQSSLLLSAGPRSQLSSSATTRSGRVSKPTDRFVETVQDNQNVVGATEPERSVNGRKRSNAKKDHYEEEEREQETIVASPTTKLNKSPSKTVSSPFQMSPSPTKANNMKTSSMTNINHNKINNNNLLDKSPTEKDYKQRARNLKSITQGLFKLSQEVSDDDQLKSAASTTNEWKSHEHVALYKIFSETPLMEPNFWDVVSRRLKEKGVQRSAKECEEQWYKVTQNKILSLSAFLSCSFCFFLIIALGRNGEKEKE